MKRFSVLKVGIFLVAFLVAAGCANPFSSGSNGSNGGSETSDNPVSVAWTWAAGSSTRNASGLYGTKNVPNATNVPGARERAASLSDASGNLWLFGGRGRDGGGDLGRLNDLWRFDGSHWTWVSGSNTRLAAGEYGTQGVGEAGNAPGARTGAASWSDASGNLWLFGGLGWDHDGDYGRLNDLWRFDVGTSEWTWVSGSDTRNAAGEYGTQGVSEPGNVPGGRANAAFWSDASANLWLFGGKGRDGEGDFSELNDLWRFDGSLWTWVSGSDTTNAAGEYGTQGLSEPGNAPGARKFAAASSDASGNLWLFGGLGYDSSTSTGRLNDLWRFAP